MTEWGPDVPDHWRLTTIGEATDTKLGRMLNAEARNGPYKVPYLRNENVRWGGFDLTEIFEMSIPPAKRPDYELRHGDVLVCEGGEIGRAAVWTHDDGPMYFQKALHRIRVRDGLVPAFVRYWLEYLAKSHRLLPYATGSTILHLPQQALRRLPLVVPPLDEQHAIVETIERTFAILDAATADARRGLQRIELLRSALAQAAVTGELLGLEVGDHGIWRTPSSWRWAAVSEVAEVRGGIQKTPARKPVKNTAPFLRVANVKREGLDLSDVHRVELGPGELERYRLSRGDLLIVEGNGSIQQIGRSCVWDGSIEDCVHQNHLIRVRPGGEITSEWLNLVWNSPSCSARVQEVAQTTTGLYTLSIAKVGSVEIPVPPLEVQERVVDAYRRRVALIDRLAQALAQVDRHAVTLRRSILKAAFEGRLTSAGGPARSVAELEEAIA